MSVEEEFVFIEGVNEVEDFLKFVDDYKNEWEEICADQWIQ